MPWDLKYRPRIFDDVVGHSVTVKILRTRIITKTALETSYVFSGPHGSGKTTLARILANAALCEGPINGNPCLQCEICRDFVQGQVTDYEERDAASKGTIDDVRRVIADLDYVATKAKVICWDEAHRMSNPSQDALLKPVEEHRLVCIFATTEPEKIRGAIRSRCDDFAIRQVPIAAVVERLTYICTQEAVEYEPDALQLISAHSAGHVRDAIKRAEMISRLGPIDVAAVKEYLRLDVHSVAYRVLLGVAQSDIEEILSGLRSMMGRVSPSDAVRILARSALQAYRRGHSFGDTVDPLDAALAIELFQAIGPNLPHVASFLADRPGRLSQEAVECRLLSLTERLKLGIVGGPEHVLVQAQQGVAAPAKTEAPKADLEVQAGVQAQAVSSNEDSELGKWKGLHSPRGSMVDKVEGKPTVVTPREQPKLGLAEAKTKMSARFTRK